VVNQRQKPVDQLVNRRGGRGRVLTVVPVKRRLPAPPIQLGEHATRAWRDFWASPVSHAVDIKADWAALKHWIQCHNERDYLEGVAIGKPLLKTRDWTPENPTYMLNPLYRRIRQLDDEIRRYEESFGMTPLSRFRLQLTFADAGNSLADLQDRKPARRAIEPEVIDMDAIG